MKSLGTKFFAIVAVLGLLYTCWVLNRLQAFHEQYQQKLMGQLSDQVLEFEKALQGLIGQMSRGQKDNDLTVALIRSVFDQINHSSGDSNYYLFRHLTMEPSVQGDTPTHEEKELIAQIYLQPMRERWLDYMDYNGRTYFVHAQPVFKPKEHSTSHRELVLDSVDIVGLGVNPLDKIYRSALFEQLDWIVVGFVTMLVLTLIAFHLLVRRRLAVIQRQCSHLIRHPQSEEILPLDITSDDEIGSLARHFNRLVQKFNRLRMDLEKQVERRTSDLSAVNSQLREQIAERVKAEQAHRVLVTAVEQAREMVMITDHEGKIEYVNPAFEEITGYQIHEVIGRNPRIFKSGKTPQSTFAQMWETISHGRQWTGRWINRKKDGSLYEEEASISPVRDQVGNVVRYIALKRDITQELVSENRQRQSQKMEAIGRLAGGVAHDFNNLLTAITGYTDLLIRRRAGQEKWPELAEIKKAAAQASSLTNQLLTFSRQRVCTPQPVDVNYIIRDMEKMMRRLIGEDIMLVTILDPALGRINADASQFGQVILNLAINARDAMPQGGRLIIATSNVRISQDDPSSPGNGLAPGSYTTISVIDSGCGMDRETQSRVFEPFFTTKEGKGTGLGLATVYGVVKQMGGDICIFSQVGQGTTFQIFLPVCEQAPLTEHKTIEDLSVPSEPSELPQGAETILLVEDEDLVRNLVGEILRKYGYTVIEAGNGQQALHVFEQYQQTIHLMVTDVVMPMMGGWELAEKITGQHPDMKILFMSGYTDNSKLQHHKFVSPTAFLPKPFSSEDLLSKVRTMLDGTKPDQPVPSSLANNVIPCDDDLLDF